MADEFDPSPQPSKRRKTGTYAKRRTTLDSAHKDVGSVLNVSNAITSLSKRLFNRSQPAEPEIHDDSAYGSKEDSLVEDEVAATGTAVDAEENGQTKETVTPKQTRSSKRSSTGPTENTETSKTRTTSSTRKWKRTSQQVECTADSQGVRSDSAASSEAMIQRSSQRKRRNQKVDEDEEPEVTTDTSKRKTRLDRGYQSNSVAVQDSQQSEPDSKDHEDAEDDGVAKEDEPSLQPRSSGRERKRPRRFSIEVSIEQPKGSQKQSRSGHKSQASVRSKTTDSSILSPQPKGILTPSRRKRLGTPKSVMFDENEKQIEQRLGFKDIQVSAKKAKASAPQTTSDFGLLEVAGEESYAANDLEIEDSADELGEDAMEEDDFIDDPALSDGLFGSEMDPVVAAAIPTMAEIGLEDDPTLTAVKAKVLTRLTSQATCPIAHLETQYKSLHTLLSTTITSGESNSLLLLGSRGSGKSLLVDTALADLTSKYQSDFHIVRLNGFFQTDDKLALREIWRQLGREMQISEDETGEVSSYADTMASLLSLLSHPEELEELNPTTELDGETKLAKSVIFILDEFDLFTTHPRQTLLYNLFDIAQARKAPIAVIGCSTRLDVVECLEKRVKSRFSHRWLHVPSMRTLLSFQEAVEGILCIAEAGSEALGLTKEELEWRARWNSYVKTALLPSQPVQALLKHTFYTTKSLPDVLTALYLPIATAQIPSTTNKAGTETVSSSSINMSMTRNDLNILSLLQTLPTLHLSLLIAAARLETIHNLTTVNFTLVYSQYVELITRSKVQRSASGVIASGAGLRQWSRETAVGAWEELAGWEVIVPVAGAAGKGVDVLGGGEDVVDGAAGGGGGGGGGGRMWKIDVTLEEVHWAVKEKLGGSGGGDVLSRWCREV